MDAIEHAATVRHLCVMACVAAALFVVGLLA